MTPERKKELNRIPDGFYWFKSTGKKSPTVIQISTLIRKNRTEVKWVDFMGRGDGTRLDCLKGYLETIKHDPVLFHINFVLGGD